MPRARYLNTARHAITLSHGQQIGPDEVGEDDIDHAKPQVEAGALLLLEHVNEPDTDTGVEAGGIPHESFLGESTIQQGPPPEQPVEPAPPGEPMKTTSRSRGRKGGESS